MSRTGIHRSLEVVAYDCADDKRRSRLANTLLSYGARVQGSVYELWITRRDRETLWHKLKAISTAGDNLRSYTLCGSCVAAILARGSALPEDESVFVS